MGQYTAGWITVPGKGKRWRTAEGEYLMERPAGGVNGVFGAIRNALGQADRAVGGWLPLPPGLDAQQPSAKALMDGAGLAAVHLGNRAQQGLVKAANRYLGQTPGLDAQAEQDKVRRTFNRQPGNTLRVAPAPPELSSQPDLLSSILGRDKPPIGSNYSSRAALFDVDFERMPRGGDMFDPGGMLRTGPTGIPGRDVIRTGATSPGWVTAHELGHLTDIRIKNPNNPFVVNALARMKEDIDTMSGMRASSRGRTIGGSHLRATTPNILGMAGASNRDRSLLQAAAEGALEGLALNSGTLRNEFAADRYGRPLAKKAGVKWDNRANAMAKGTYIAGSSMPSVTANVVGELLNRGVETVGDLYGEYVVDPLARRMRGGDSAMESGLRSYGYNPETHRLKPGPDGNLEYTRRRGK